MPWLRFWGAPRREYRQSIEQKEQRHLAGGFKQYFGEVCFRLFGPTYWSSQGRMPWLRLGTLRREYRQSIEIKEQRHLAGAEDF